MKRIVLKIEDTKRNDNPRMVKISDLPNRIQSDIKEYCSSNGLEKQLEDDFMRYETAIEYYLLWNGISGFGSQIVDIVEASFEAKIEFQK